LLANEIGKIETWDRQIKLSAVQLFPGLFSRVIAVQLLMMGTEL
jgi:hypothetical protein